MTAEFINDYLLKNYGRDVMTGQMKWRIVWTPDQIEKKYETYEDITASGLYLGTKTGMRDKPKYWYLPDCFLLERLYVVESDAMKEALGSPYSYEPCLPFLDASNNPLPLKLEAVQYFLRNFYNAERRVRDLQAEQEKKDQQEVQRTRDILYESDTVDALHYGEGVVVPANYKKEDVNV